MLKNQTQEKYRIRRNMLAFWKKGFHIYDGTGKLIGYFDKQPFKLKEDICVYTDETKTKKLFYLRSKNEIGYVSAFEILDGKTGRELGVWLRRQWLLLIRDAWMFEYIENRKSILGEILERWYYPALLRRWFGGYFIPQKFLLLVLGHVKILIRKRFNPFVFKLDITFYEHFNDDITNLFLAGIVLLATVEAKQCRGKKCY